MPELPRFGSPRSLPEGRMDYFPLEDPLEGGEAPPDDTSEGEFGPDPRSYEARITGTGRPIPLEEAKERGWVPPREELKKLPKTVLLKIAIELDPDAVSESFQEGWTKDDILRVIERHLKSALGRAGEEGSEYIHDVEIIDSEAVEEQYPEAASLYEKL